MICAESRVERAHLPDCAFHLHYCRRLAPLANARFKNVDSQLMFDWARFSQHKKTSTGTLPTQAIKRRINIQLLCRYRRLHQYLTNYTIGRRHSGFFGSFHIEITEIACARLLITK